MSTMTIVEDLDVLEDGRPGLLSGRPGLAMEQLGLEWAKKLSATALSQHVPGADALLEAVLGQPAGVGPGQVLGAAVGMVDQAGQQDGVRPAPW